MPQAFTVPNARSVLTWCPCGSAGCGRALWKPGTGMNPVGVNPVGMNPVGVSPVGVNPVGVSPVAGEAGLRRPAFAGGPLPSLCGRHGAGPARYRSHGARTKSCRKK